MQLKSKMVDPLEIYFKLVFLTFRNLTCFTKTNLSNAGVQKVGPPIKSLVWLQGTEVRYAHSTSFDELLLNLKTNK